MTEKLDPVLLEYVEQAEAGQSPSPDAAAPGAAVGTPSPELDVLVAIDRAADDDILADAGARGLRVRSVVGDILTGSIGIGDVRRLAEAEHVVRIEAGRPMHPEAGDPGGRREGPDSADTDD